LVPFATSLFHDPGEIEPGSVFHVMEVVVTVIKPEEPVNNVPITPAEAEGSNTTEAITAQQIAPNFGTYLFSIIFLR